MIWNKLVDRCLLFTDAPGGLLKSLLKEAESELANKLELYDALYTIEVPNTISGLGVWSQSADNSTFDNNYTKLPPNYLKDISVTHKGSRLRKMSEEEIYRHSNDNNVSSGTPTGYAISGDFIVFNTAPAVGDKFILHYKATMVDRTTDKVLTILDYLSTGPTIWLDTELGSLLDTYKLRWENALLTLSSGGLDHFPGHVPGLPDKGVGNQVINNVATANYNVNTYASNYTINALLGAGAINTSVDSNGVGAPIGSMCRIVDYRNVAPLIPERFRTSLCDYAIALGNAKQSPDTYNRHWLKWESGMDSLMSEAQDRDLIFSIKEEI